MNFTNMNSTCTKDGYPLLRINTLVDFAVNYLVKSFLDAFFGYHQINMHPEDYGKKAFIIVEGLYYYKVMPIRLKNVGSTY